MKNFGDRLREARIAAGLTQEQLGFALGVTKSSVSAWENGRETPGFKLLPELGQTLHRSLDELISGIDPPTARPDGAAQELRASNTSEQTLLIRYRRLPPKRREAVLELLKPDSRTVEST
jgi:transcriptional regulator with XRE-family HTH domain